MPNSPSFRTRPRAPIPSHPPAPPSRIYSFLLSPSLSFFPSSSVFPSGPSLLPSLNRLPFWGWEPRPHPPIQPRGLASPGRPGSGSLHGAPTLSCHIGWDTNASSSGSGRGSPGDRVQEVLESMHQLVSVPSKNTHGSLGFPEFRVTAAQTDD